MDLQALLKKLDIEDGEQFEYFENFADLVEADEDISDSVLFQLFSKADGNTVADLIHNYFEEIMAAMPDAEEDLFLLMENIKKCLMGLIKTSNEDQDILNSFVVELNRFKVWYSTESKVVCKNIETGETSILPIRDAIVNCRLESLGEGDFSYDFSSCMDFEINEYIMDLVDYAQADEESEMGEGLGFDEYDDYERANLADSSFEDYCDCGCHDHHHHH